jgi:hypothetical protein
MRNAALFAGLAITLVLIKFAYAADLYPTNKTRAYEDLGWRTWLSWGTLNLSETSATFSNLRGSLKLQYAGPMPANAGTRSNPGRVYKILNSAEFFAANRTNKIFQCKEIKFLGLLTDDLSKRSPETINVTLYEGNSYTNILHEKADWCWVTSYRLQ